MSAHHTIVSLLDDDPLTRAMKQQQQQQSAKKERSSLTEAQLAQPRALAAAIAGSERAAAAAAAAASASASASSSGAPTDARMAMDIAIRKSEESLTHLVSRGDTLQGISIKYGISIENLKRSNNLWNQNALMIKKSVAIPIKFCTPEALIELGWQPGTSLAALAAASTNASGASTSGQSNGSVSANQLLQKYDSQLAQSKAFVSKLDSAFPEPPPALAVARSTAVPRSGSAPTTPQPRERHFILPENTERPASFDKGKRKLNENEHILDDDLFSL
ncbi:hypothetical protein CAOG_02168 [Capsaspora owczarzaki ATCC 30864]|uniref:LysM domain-containing protein n=1 Tax=Capsaspora owczarzaki (strain ATCC 30864) TaxID=595528 RepID=A0A0D2X1K0_CAPO3|nr:hypothetical protein CAOG_02168 [Capsaspora owczarzaki ATCC 30864]KJE90944.1 hypothetical protein CAOG_002168 [Capsaspora owczarzaki ATCC 30864]|eukprot:XP_004348918.1 hypothetical protein CAOG_02168 [Capsaspora owczarzaki ATCC 30864]